VLKKAGIVVALTTAGLFAASPMALAQGSAPAQVSNNCSFSQTGPIIVTSGTGAAVIAPVTIQTQALNCNAVNVSDVVDNNSNNTTRTYTRTIIRNSFNNFSGFPFRR
jgi:hypothetical protein